MDRILVAATVALLYSTSALAADDARTTNRIQQNLITYQEDGYGEMKPVFQTGKFEQLTKTNLMTDENTISESPVPNRSSLATNIRPGVSPLFGTYNVFRTNGNQDGSSYVTLGFNFDELTGDEAETSFDNDESDLSFGFGIDNSSFNIEYLIYVNEENYEPSAISLGFVSAF